MLGGVPVTTAWCVFGLRTQARPPDMEVSCEYIEKTAAERTTRGGPPAWGGWA
jgi:hypothetical protein